MPRPFRHTPARWLAALLVSLALALPGGAWAQASLATFTGYWLDRSQQAGLDEAMRATYQPHEHLLGLGYGAEPVWIKLTLPPRTEQDGYVVTVLPSFLDRITLYDPVTGRVLASGDQMPPQADEMISPMFSFKVPALAEARDVYLHVQTQSTRLVLAKVTTLAQAQRQSIVQTAIFGFVISVSLMFGLGATAMWLYLRDKVMGWYAVSQNMATVFALLTTGFARMLLGERLPPGGLDALTSTFILGLMPTTLWFICTLFREYRPPRVLLRLGFTLAWLGFGLMVLGLSGQWRLALQINAALGLLVSFLPMLLTLFAAPDEQRAVAFPRSLLLIYTGYLLTVHLNHLTFLGWSAPRELVFYSNSIHCLVHGLVISSILLLRAKAMARMRHEMALQLAHEQQQIQVEKQHLAEQEKLFTMLAHELKTPLATLRMRLDAGGGHSHAIERAITDMNQIIERCVQTGQLTDHKLVPLFENVDLAQATRTAIGLCHAPERIALELPATPAPVRADAQILTIVLTNLLDNACKYSAAQTPIHARLCAARVEGEDGWAWQIANQPGAAGMPSPERVFEKYYRSAQARRQSGSGLGLFLVKGLVTLMRGTIRYAPEQDRVVFTVWFPSARV